MATFTLFLALPSEIQILILRHYLPKWEFNISVSQSRSIPANFRIGTGCPFNFIFRAAGRRNDLCVLWTSRELYGPAKMALEQSFTRTLELFTPGNWHYPQRKPMFDAFVLPGLPARTIKTIRLDVNVPVIRGPKAPPKPSPKDYLSWRDLIEFADFRKLPALECLSIVVSQLSKFDFPVEQVSDVLKGDHDEMIIDGVRQMLPKVHPGQKRQITTPSGATLKLEVITQDELSSWVPTWTANIPANGKSIISVDLEGKNTEDLQVRSRTTYSLDKSGIPDRFLHADGSTWEAVAAKY